MNAHAEVFRSVVGSVCRVTRNVIYSKFIPQNDVIDDTRNLDLQYFTFLKYSGPSSRLLNNILYFGAHGPQVLTDRFRSSKVAVDQNTNYVTDLINVRFY